MEREILKDFGIINDDHLTPVKSRVEKICEVCKTKGEACKTCPAAIDDDIKVYKAKG